MGLAIKMVIMERQVDVACADVNFCATSSSTSKYNFLIKTGDSDRGTDTSFGGRAAKNCHNITATTEITQNSYFIQFASTGDNEI